jgi:uncharacterized membrane protein YtjA (UPF0391 family)
VRYQAKRKRLSAQSYSKNGRSPNGNRLARRYHRLHHQPTGDSIMLKWALFFAIVAIIAGLLGFTGVAAGAAAIAKFLFVVFLILCVVFLVLGFVITKKIVD